MDIKALHASRFNETRAPRAPEMPGFNRSSHPAPGAVMVDEQGREASGAAWTTVKNLAVRTAKTA